MRMRRRLITGIIIKGFAGPCVFHSAELSHRWLCNYVKLCENFEGSKSVQLWHLLPFDLVSFCFLSLCSILFSLPLLRIISVPSRHVLRLIPSTALVEPSYLSYPSRQVLTGSIDPWRALMTWTGRRL